MFAAPIDFKVVAESVKSLYTSDNPSHAWVIAATICVVACLPKSTRRWGAIGLCVVGVAFVLGKFLGDAFKAYT